MALADYLHGILGGLAEQLGWTVEAGSYTTIVSETLELYGVSDESDATNTKKLHSIGKVELWKAVQTEILFDYDVSVDGGDYKRSQMQKAVQIKLDSAVSEASTYLSGYEIQAGEVTTEQDPYIDYPPYYDRSIV